MTDTITPPEQTQPEAAPAAFQRRSRCRRHAFIGYKGGAGKTTCVVCVAEAAAQRYMNVLVIDMDGQANATRRLQAFDHQRPTLADVLHPTSPVPITDAMTVCGWGAAEQAETGENPYPWAERIHVVQAPSLTQINGGCEQLETRIEESHLRGAVNRLRVAMNGIPQSAYDLVLIDTAPAMSHGLDMVLAALDDPDDRLWIVTNPLFDAIEGGLKFHGHVYRNREMLLVPHLEVAGVIVNDYLPSSEVHAEVYHQIPGMFPAPVLPHYLPRHRRWDEVCNNGLPVAAYPELHKRRYVTKGEPPLPSFVERMEAMTGAIIDAE